MNLDNHSNVVIFVLVVGQLSHCLPADYEDVVPEEPPEVPPPSDMSDTNSPSLSQSAIDEYLKEHPEAKNLVNSKGKIKMKRIFNQYGDIVMVPDTDDKLNQPQQNQSTDQNVQGLPPGLPPPLPLPFYAPYQMNPYYNPIPLGYDQEQVQGQGQSQAMVPPFPPLGYPTANGSQFNQVNRKSAMNELLKLAQSYPDENTNTSTNGSADGDLPVPLPPMQAMPPMSPMFQMSGMPYPPFGPFPANPYFAVDGQNMQVMPLPLPDGVGMDPNLMRELENGRAKLDMANARIEPYGQTTEADMEPEMMATESDTLEDRPELPEVVIPKPKRRPRPKAPKRRGKHGKPYFLMRARLKDLPDGHEKDPDKWWNKPVADYCFEEIVEITKCKHKQLEKRWSFNKSDEKCYLYEDLCHSMKLNTFKSLKDCMITCWRPKK